MVNTATMRARRWLLYGMLVLLAVPSASCDVCDGFSFVPALSRPLIGQQRLATLQDSCHGLCSCCGLQGLPSTSFTLSVGDVALASEILESPRAAAVPRCSVFRPQRI